LLSDTAIPAANEEGLKPEHFYRDSYGAIFAAMLDLNDKGQPVDSLTLREYLSHHGTLEGVGGRAALDLLSGSVPEVSNFRSYCRIVIEKYKWRIRLRSAYRQQMAVMNEDLDEHGRAMYEADHVDKALEESHVNPAEDFIKWYESDTHGIPTPFDVLTKALGGGFLPGDVTIIGAWPGHGKTVLADMCVLHARREVDARCHIYFNELHSALRTARMLARLTQLPWWNIRDKNLGSGELAAVLKAVSQDMPAEYQKVEGWDVDRICRHIRRYRWDLCVVDTASRIPASDTKAVEVVSGKLADVARETNTHVILTVQLNLERVKQAIKPVPTARDLLGGGAWWRDARNVLFVWRKQEKIPNMDDMTRALLEGWIVTDKATHGEPEKGFVPVTFVPKYMTYEERDVAVPDASDDYGADTAAEAEAAGTVGNPVDNKGQPMEF
jgi:replicative DNA helicase